MANNFDSYGLQLYLGVLNGDYTHQDFIDYISNNIDNNRIKSHLQSFLQRTIELEEFYHLANQNASPRFAFQSVNNQQGDPIIFNYYVRKNPMLGNYCMYISIPAGHPFHGRPYLQVANATYYSVDEEDPSRWVFGWDYARYDILTTTSIYMHYARNPAILLEMRILTKNLIEDDVARYANILASQ